jgi:hypothetical protein
MTGLLCLLLLCIPLTSQGQFTYLLEQTVPVEDAQKKFLPLAWAGGLNAAQFNTMDLNEDGNPDLVLFDRMADKISTFISLDNHYIYAPEFENFFPEEISNWLLLRDYNCDGKKDIFTGDVLGIRVYTNTTVTGGDLQWKHYLFSTGNAGSKSPVVLTEGSTTKINLQLQFDDLPSISDVDGDGDLDILNIQYAGHTVEFHQNVSIENSLPCDSLEFKRVTRAWGDFRECECGEFALNGTDCPRTGGRTKHAGGKALLALDLNGDNEQDLLFSEAECNRLFALSNGGTSLNPVINRFSPFPETNPVNFVIYPAAYHEDVDFDGKKDLIASPNMFTKELLNSDLRQSTWLYTNTGTHTAPVFTFAAPDFLQGNMIDVGDNAVPAFADYDADADFDMFISSHSSPAYSSSLYLYENIGSASAPAFRLLTNDYLGFSTMTFYNLKIQFADIDSDQKTDLVFTATTLEDNATRLYYLPNKSGTGLNFSASTLQLLNFNLTNSENIYVTDVNDDRLPDILAGRSEGNLEYWKNTGIDGAPLFMLEEENFLEFSPSPFRQNLSCATGDLDADGEQDLIVGDPTGRLTIVADFKKTASGESAETNIVFNRIRRSYREMNFGGRIWPSMVNLFHTDKPAIAVGNVLGGVYLLRNDEGNSLPEVAEIDVYPNPVANNEVLNIRVDRPGIMQIISILGQRVSPALALKANHVYRYTLPPLSSGLYVLEFKANERSHIERFVIK